MKIISLVMVFFAGFACTAQKISGVELTSRIYIGDRDSLIEESSYAAYQSGRIKMYQFPFFVDSSIIFLDTGERQTLLEERRNMFFIYNEDSSYGQAYYPNKAVERLAKDSILKYTYETHDFDTLGVPDTSFFDEMENYLVKIFSFTETATSPGFSLYFYYGTKLKNVSETFSRKMDNVSGMKLEKLRIEISEWYNEESKMRIPASETRYEMKETPVPAEVTKYFHEYAEQNNK